MWRYHYRLFKAKIKIPIFSEGVMSETVYAGFWVRTFAAIIDSIFLLAVIIPVLTVIYGTDYWFGTLVGTGFWFMIINYFVPALVVILFWIYSSATPGKTILNLVIVDVDTGKKPSTGQCIVRYLSYYLSALPLLIGIVWVAVDNKKQGLHDKLARTVVIRAR